MSNTTGEWYTMSEPPVNNDPEELKRYLQDEFLRLEQALKLLHIDGEWGANTMSKDFYYEVAAGNIAGKSIMSAMGERETMGVTTAGEDVWRGNNLTPAPTSHTSIPVPAAAGEQMTVVSESTDDVMTTGDGAWSVEIHYLDAAGAEQVETVDLNGQTPVNTDAIDIRFVNDFHVNAVGSDGVAAGHIKIYKTGTVGLVYNMIALGGNKSLVPNRMVPAGKKLILKGWDCSEAKDKRVAFRIRATSIHGTLLTGIFLFKDSTYIKNTSSGELTLNESVPALAIVKVSAWPDANLAEGSASWWGVMEDV